MEDPHLRNLRTFQAAETVRDYTPQDALKASEQYLFDRYIRQGCRILDLGVGTGRTTRSLSSLASRYVGVDYASTMIDVCRRKFPSLDFRVMDASDLSVFESSSFDVVVFSFNGLTYLYPHECRHRCLDEIARVLRPEGLFMFSVVNPRSLFLRPFRAGSGLSGAALGIVRTLGPNARRVVTRLSSSVFWRGRGYHLVDSHGGLCTFMAVPGQVRSELESHGFEFLDICDEDVGRRRSRFTTRWYDYVFRRR